MGRGTPKREERFKEFAVREWAMRKTLVVWASKIGEKDV
jgi:hypothetical protein